VTPRPWHPWARRLLLLAILALAFYLRVRDARYVFVDGRVLVAGYDEYYHLRRIQKTVESFPHVPMFDSYANYPEGADIYWPAGFDLAMATIAKLGRARPWTVDVERICAWAIPALGLLTVAAAYWLGTLWRGRAVGLVAAATTAVLPAAIGVSDIGGVDHDVAVILLVGAAFGCLLAAFRSEGSVRRCAGAVAGGLLLGSTLWIWPGAIGFVLLLPVAFFCRALISELLGRPAPQGLGIASLTAAVAAAVVVAACASTPPLRLAGTSPVFLSRFQAILAGGSALGLGMLSVDMLLAGESRLWRALLVGATLSIIVLAFAVFCFFQLAAARLFMERHADLVVATADEAQPLLAQGVGGAAGSLTWAALLFPLAWAMVIGQALTGKRRPADWLIAAWAGATALLAISQRRFAPHFAVPLALCLAALVHWVWSSLSTWRAGDRLLARIAIVAGFAVAAATPTDRWRPSPYAPNWELRAVLPALDWLRTQAAPGGEINDFRTRPPYAVMAFWHYGHWITYLGQRANIANPFGNMPQHQEGLRRFIQFFGARTEREAAELCEKLGVRYVLSTDLVLPLMVHLAGLDERQLYRQQVMATSLQLWRGQRAPGEGRPLQHFLLVKEFPGEAPSGMRLNTLVFEFVPAAVPH